MKRCLLIRPFLILWSFNKKKKKLTNTSSEVVANFFLEGEHDDKIKFHHHIPESIFPYQKWKYTIFICIKNEVKFSFKSVHLYRLPPNLKYLSFKTVGISSFTSYCCLLPVRFCRVIVYSINLFISLSTYSCVIFLTLIGWV